MNDEFRRVGKYVQDYSQIKIFLTNLLNAMYFSTIAHWHQKGGGQSNSERGYDPNFYAVGLGLR
jgi:hypothetical protein